MKIAIVAAGFTPSEADRLRRAMATFRHVGTIGEFRTKLIEGMVRNGYERDFAERCFRQIEGFGDYGFPESHAASFALLVYVSAWLKCHYPDVFAAAILNSQPMGFYAPAQLVRDAREHGVSVLAADVNHSDWDCTLEAAEGGARPRALRLGLRQIKGLAAASAEAIVKAREEPARRPFADPADLRDRSGLPVSVLEILAGADSFGSTGRTRRQALWAVRALGPAPLPLFARAGARRPEPGIALPPMSPGEEVSQDYATIRMSLKDHPLALMRGELAEERVTPAGRLVELDNGARVTVAGLVLVRQRPGTASGVIFVTLEDETGIANLVVWPRIFERYRREAMAARLLRVSGELQREGIVIHVVARRLEDLTHRLRALAAGAGPLKPPLARADEIARPSGADRRQYPSRDFH